MRRALAIAAIAVTLAAATARTADILPESGAVPDSTMRRLLIADAAAAGNRLVAVGDRGWIVLSDDRGAHWKRAKSPAAPLLTAVDFIDDKRGWAVGHDAMILATVDGGETWTKQFSGPLDQGPLLGVQFVDANRGFAVGAYGAFYETSDGGAKWAPRKVVADDKHLNAIVDAGKGNLVVLGEAGTILRSGDSGATWQPVASPYKGSFFGGTTTRDGAVLAFGLRGRIYRSIDAGKTWTQVANALEASLMNASVLADGAIALTGAAGTLLVSRDNGQTFTPLASGRRGVISKALAGAPGVILLLGEAGVHELRAGGEAK